MAVTKLDWNSAAALIDGYTPQELYTGWEKVETLPKFFTGTLINQQTKYHTTKKFSFDIKDERATVPTYCTPKSMTSLVEFGGFETVESTTPYINEGFEITVDDFETRPFGISATEYGKLSMNQRVALVMMDKDRQMKKRLDAIAEVQLAEQLQTGIIPVSGKDVDLEISVRMAADHLVTLTGDACWTAAASIGTRLASILAECKKIRDDRGGVATDIYMDALSYANLVADPQYFERLNRRNTSEGTYDPKMIDGAGFIQNMGTLELEGWVLNIWVNSAVYTSNAGVETPYLKANTYILLNRNTPFRQHYGRIDNMKAWAAGMDTSDVYTYSKVDPDGKWARKVYETAPVVACEDMSGVVTVTTDS